MPAPWRPYIKAAPTFMARIESEADLSAAIMEADLPMESFAWVGRDLRVNTREGWLRAALPVMLALDAQGHPYPIHLEAFEATYVPLMGGA